MAKVLAVAFAKPSAKPERVTKSWSPIMTPWDSSSRWGVSGSGIQSPTSRGTTPGDWQPRCNVVVVVVDDGGGVGSVDGGVVLRGFCVGRPVGAVDGVAVGAGVIAPAVTVGDMDGGGVLRGFCVGRPVGTVDGVALGADDFALVVVTVGDVDGGGEVVLEFCAGRTVGAVDGCLLEAGVVIVTGVTMLDGVAVPRCCWRKSVRGLDTGVPLGFWVGIADGMGAGMTTISTAGGMAPSGEDVSRVASIQSTNGPSDMPSMATSMRRALAMIWRMFIMVLRLVVCISTAGSGSHAHSTRARIPQRTDSRTASTHTDWIVEHNFGQHADTKPLSRAFRSAAIAPRRWDGI